MVLGCDPVAMSNQSTFVLGYLLLMGYDVSGQTYLLLSIIHISGFDIENFPRFFWYDHLAPFADFDGAEDIMSFWNFHRLHL